MNPFAQIKPIALDAGMFALGGFLLLGSIFGFKQQWVRWSALALGIMGAAIGFSHRPVTTTEVLPNSLALADLPTNEQIRAWRLAAENPPVETFPGYASTRLSPPAEDPVQLAAKNALGGRPLYPTRDRDLLGGRPLTPLANPLLGGRPLSSVSGSASSRQAPAPWIVTGPHAPDDYGHLTKQEVDQRLNPDWLWWAPKK